MDARYPFTLVVTGRNGTMHTTPHLSFIAVDVSTKGLLTVTTEGRFPNANRSENLKPESIASFHIEVAASAPEPTPDGADPAVHAGAKGARGKDGAR